MPSWCTLYKGVLALFAILIVLEYLFGSIIETKNLENIFSTSNSTRSVVIDKNVQQIHSPLLNALISANKKITNKSVDTTNNDAISLPLNNSTVVIAVNASNVATFFELSTEFEILTEINKSANNNTNNTLPLCPENPPDLGEKVDVIMTPVPSILQLERRFSWLKYGGHSTPDTCRAQEKVALIIPFRCRSEHLLLFLQHMHPYLRRQQLDYTIYIIEQDNPGDFNRAMLMNIGYKEALKYDNYDCFIFHDIDLLPEDERNLYTCPQQPRHMSVAVDKFDYKLPYPTIFGGVSAITRVQFQILNGFSNVFWGWGGEDDDMSNRIRYHNLHIARYPPTIARYTMLTHTKEKANPTRNELLKAGKTKYNTEGLSNLKYKLVQKNRNLLYTWILADVRPDS